VINLWSLNSKKVDKEENERFSDYRNLKNRGAFNGGNLRVWREGTPDILDEELICRKEKSVHMRLFLGGHRNLWQLSWISHGELF